METNQTAHRSDELCSFKSSEPNNEIFKAAISPPTPLLLLPPPLTENALAAENNSGESNLIEQTKPVKQLALIEAHDSNELNLILNTIKQIFPGVNVQICSNPNEEASKENKSYLTVSRTNCSSPDSSKLSNVSRYCLSTKPAEKKACDRASSIDNSSFNMSMERQESKDSGFWTRTKCSFESMKSLSISDQPALKITNTNNSSNVNVNGNNTMNTNENVDNETNRTNAPLSPSMSSGFNLNANSSKIVPEAQNENFLTSPRSSVSCNWKKWKKGQAWRYNSSSNNNLADTSTSSGQIDSASGVRTKDASFNSENSSFSIERTEDESNESYSATNNSYFSNSFELATSKLSLLTTHQSNLQPSWSSTSKLEVLNNPDCTNSTHQQKRRGKLVRERTIDNSDEQSSASAFNSFHRENIKFASSSNLNTNDASEPRHESSRRFSKDGSPIPPNCTSPSIQQQQQNGRVSPPEKRLSLNLKSEPTEEDIQAAIAQLHGLTSQSKLDANEIKQIMANVLTNKYFVSEELVKKITEINSEQHQQLRLNPSVSPVSSCPSPFSPGSSSSAAGLIPNVNKLSLLSPPSKSMSPNEFHKDLQTKLNLKSSFDSDDKADMQECINNINNNINDNDNNDSNKNTNNNNKLHDSTNRNSYMLKTGSSSSFDFKFINNNYLSNGLPSQLSSNNTNNINSSSSNNSNNITKSIYRSNSSPSYSSQLIDPVSMLSSPSFTKNVSEINSDPPKLSNYHSTVYFPFSFDFPKQNHSSQQQQHQQQQYNPNSPNFQQQQQQHLIQKQSFYNDFNTYYPINPLELNISLSTKNQQQQYQLSNSRLIKPPAIVITESKVDNIQIDYEENEGKKSDFQSNQNASAEMITRPSDFNRSKFINNSYCFNQSFSNFVKKPSENMFNATNNWKISNPISLLNQSKEIKSPNSLQSPSSLNSSSKSLKPHICGSCQKRFARSDMLIRHSRLHSGVRPYRCNRCGQEFSRSDHLNTHLRTHTGEKPYTCPHPKCSYAACRKDMITRHLKVHSKNAVNRLSMSFDTANLAENSMLNVASSATGALFNNLNRMETFCFENKSTMKNNLENMNHKSTSSLASF